MLLKPTVLILGAGASAPFLFPTGQGLLDLIAKQASEPSKNPMGQTLLMYGFGKEAIQEFGSALHHSQWHSVDRFLEYRTDFLEIGKAAIAAALIPFEIPQILFGKRDWYQYLFNVMGTSFEGFGHNRLTVVSYNYDRSLQYYLLSALVNAFGKNPADCAAKLSSIPFVYLHGQLGSLNTSEAGGRNFRPDVNPEIVRGCVPLIKIIHETAGEEEQFITAQKAIFSAERVCFLGFGYDDRNLQRLFPPGLLAKIKLRRFDGTGRIVGSAFGLTDAEKLRVQKRFDSTIELGDRGWGNLDLLKETGILLD